MAGESGGVVEEQNPGESDARFGGDADVAAGGVAGFTGLGA